MSSFIVFKGGAIRIVRPTWAIEFENGVAEVRGRRLILIAFVGAEGEDMEEEVKERSFAAIVFTGGRDCGLTDCCWCCAQLHSAA